MSAHRFLIVDGYNVMNAGEPYVSLAAEDLDAARARLVSDVAAYAHGEHAALVVFDGAKNPHSDGAPHVIAGVEVIFSPYLTDADSVIEQAASIRRSAGHEVTVVTSDAQTQWAVMGAGVTRMSSAELIAEIAGERAEHSDYTPSGNRRSTISERVDRGVSEVLARWARGEP
ncbi:MAG: NYN domain-containing protein [Anaerosomatales bacterium]|nr:NYN domain-containing protein [Anaerosomatales bacterium]MDT8434054.1 NYN domain-containing protein [Anaerosomatales bacterium]